MRTLSALPLNPTRVPRRVYRFCDADSETDRSEYGAPTTSNRASKPSENELRILIATAAEYHTSRLCGTGRGREGQVISVDRRLGRWRCTDLDASRLTMDPRNHSSPGQSPDTWHGGSHGAESGGENFTSVASSRPEKTREIVAPIVQRAGLRIATFLPALE